MTANERHPVRPRWVWGGAALTVIGLALTSVELITESRTWAIVGAVVVLLGLVLAWAGGVLYDVNTSRSTETEVEEALHGGTHEGVSALERNHDPRAELISEHAEQQRRRRIASTASAPAPLAPAGVFVLFASGLWLFVSEGALGYPLTSAASEARLREDGVAVVVVLAALWLRIAGRNVVASALCLVSGGLLVLAGLFITDVGGNVRGSEVVSGLLIVAAALATMLGSWGSFEHAEVEREEAHE